MQFEPRDGERREETHASGRGDERNMSLEARKGAGQEERVMWMLGLRSQI